MLTQFLCPRTNMRTDEYGGSFENRSRLPLEIVRQTRQAVGKDFILIFRISLLDLVDNALAFDECVALAQQLQEAGATILNTGTYCTMQQTKPACYSLVGWLCRSMSTLTEHLACDLVICFSI